jgi:hypothetical protein
VATHSALSSLSSRTSISFNSNRLGSKVGFQLLAFAAAQRAAKRQSWAAKRRERLDLVRLNSAVGELGAAPPDRRGS